MTEHSPNPTTTPCLPTVGSPSDKRETIVRLNPWRLMSNARNYISPSILSPDNTVILEFGADDESSLFLDWWSVEGCDAFNEWLNTDEIVECPSEWLRNHEEGEDWKKI